MTNIFFGDRECIIENIKHCKLIDASYEGFDNKSVEALWRRRAFKPEPLAVLNPPEPTKTFGPRDGYHILFDKKVPAAWIRWAKTNRVKLVECVPPEASAIKEILTKGALGVKFNKDAADWYVRLIGTSKSRLEMEVSKLRLLGQTQVDLQTAITCIGGVDSVKAENIVKTLGTPLACQLIKFVEVKKAIPLMVYLGKAIKHRENDWVIALNTIKAGADSLKFDYWTGIQMFAHYCLANPPGREKPENLLRLMAICGVANWID